MLFGGCRFDASIAADASVTCTSSADCLSGLACQLPAGICVERTLFDQTPPGLAVAPTLALTPLATYQPDLPPTAAGPRVQALIRFVASEPLSTLPEVTVESVVALTCVLSTAEAPVFTLACTVPLSATGTGTASVRVALSDLAQLSATLELARFEVDADAPPPPLTSTADQAVLQIRPWGDISRPDSVAELSLGACQAGQRVLRAVPSTPAGGSASSQFVQCTALPATAVAFNPDVIGASLEAFDGAGNPSMQVPVHWLDVVASPRHTRINASPHHLRPLGALPDGPLAAPSLDAGLEPAWSLDRTPLVIGGESLLTTDFPSIYAADLSRLGDQENLTVDPFAGRQPPTAHDAWADENFTGVDEWWSARSLRRDANTAQWSTCSRELGCVLEPQLRYQTALTQDLRRRRTFYASPSTRDGGITIAIGEWLADGGLPVLGSVDCADRGILESLGLRQIALGHLGIECEVLFDDNMSFIATQSWFDFDLASDTSRRIERDAGLVWHEPFSDTFVTGVDSVLRYSYGATIGIEPASSNGALKTDGGLISVSARVATDGVSSWPAPDFFSAVGWYEARQTPLYLVASGGPAGLPVWSLPSGVSLGPEFTEGPADFNNFCFTTPLGPTLTTRGALVTLLPDAGVTGLPGPTNQLLNATWDWSHQHLWVVNEAFDLYRRQGPEDVDPDGGWVRVGVSQQVSQQLAVPHVQHSRRYDALVSVGSGRRYHYASQRPALVLDVVADGLPALGASPSSIELVARAVAHRRTNTGDSAGVELGAWLGPFYETLPSTTDDGGVLHATVEGEALARLLRYRQTWTFVVTPLARNGGTQAVLEVDAIEVIVHSYQP